jgi:hypothetical protein
MLKRNFVSRSVREATQFNFVTKTSLRNKQYPIGYSLRKEHSSRKQAANAYLKTIKNKSRLIKYYE